jgi:hypothetical protein
MVINIRFFSFSLLKLLQLFLLMALSVLTPLSQSADLMGIVKPTAANGAMTFLGSSPRSLFFCGELS